MFIVQNQGTPCLQAGPQVVTLPLEQPLCYLHALLALIMLFSAMHLRSHLRLQSIMKVLRLACHCRFTFLVKV